MTSSLVGSEMCIRDRFWQLAIRAAGPMLHTWQINSPVELQARGCTLTGGRLSVLPTRAGPVV
eukprot:10039380-Prorocentrum_lima.AAC.1